MCVMKNKNENKKKKKSLEKEQKKKKKKGPFVSKEPQSLCAARQHPRERRRRKAYPSSSLSVHPLPHTLSKPRKMPIAAAAVLFFVHLCLGLGDLVGGSGRRSGNVLLLAGGV